MIFLSHSSSNSELLRPLVQALKDAKVDVWFDDDIELSGSISGWMQQGLARAEKLLVAWSQSANLSRHVWNEIDAFYIRKHEPGAILLLLLDDAEIPDLYEARKYVRWHDPVSSLAASIQGWAAGASAHQIQEARSPLPAAHLLHQFPRGPRVELRWITDELISAYAEQLNRAGRARTVIMKAVRLRVEADPGDPTVTPLRLRIYPPSN